MNDDQLLLASAYLDDDLAPADRARAEADPDVMAEVARLVSLRDALRDVEPPAADRRERAITAALAAFAGEPAVVAPPTPLRQRRAWWGGVAAAAALVVAIAAGAAIFGGADGGGDDSAADVDLAAAATEAPAEEAARTEALSEAADAAGGGEGTEDAAAPEATAASEATAAPAEGTTAASAGDAVFAAPGPDLRTREDLRAYADADRSDTAELAPANCDEPGEYLGPATYEGRPVEIFASATRVTAVDGATCEPVLTVTR